MEPLAPSPLPAAAPRSAERAPGANERLVALAVPARRVSASAVLSASRTLRAMADEPPSVVWVPAAGDGDDRSFVGWGTAARVDGHGDDRFLQARAGAARLFERIERAHALPFAPRLFGGFAFDPADGRPADDLRATSALARSWGVFGDIGFMLPHIMYSVERESAHLLAFVPEADVRSAAAALDDLRGALDALPPEAEAGASAGRAPVQEPRASDRERAADAGDTERAWTDLVSRALAAIDERVFAKVVLCRTRRLAFADEPDLVRAFAFLEPRHPGCARFLFARAGATFLGATPERLLSVRGRRAVTEALAGSIPRRSPGDDTAARAELLASAKDRAEHAFVVDAIRTALAPACAALTIPAEPAVRSLAHVHHLATPITATLRDHAHILDLAARLHPTPALCGSPTAEARAFLRAHEPEPRGWYGGAVGWLDATGDGALHVAIRSALVAAREAWIYAGAGIVRGSDPARELVETLTKERAMRDALEAAS